MEEGTAMVQAGGLDLVPIEQIRGRLNAVRELMRGVMEKDKHYGNVPGTSKPTLLKPGAELLNAMFRLAPKYETETATEGDHITITSRCLLTNMATGMVVAEGLGMCSTKESKYAFRTGHKSCPSCGVEAIYKSKAEFGGGYYCNAKAGGCGASFKKGNEKTAEIDKQQDAGKVANEYLADQYNTVMKMSNKRALVAATLNATAASEIFTQDVEDMEENAQAGNPKVSPKEATKEAPKSAPAAAAPAPKPGCISQKQQARLWALSKKGNKTQEAVKAYLNDNYGIESTSDIKHDDYDDICAWAESVANSDHTQQ